MMAAFTAVVVVQWLWIKYAIRERETKFTSQVYDVLNRVVNRIDEFNYLRYKQEMNEQIGEIKNYNDLIASQQGGTSSEWYSNNLFNILNNDINRLKGERSYLFSVVPYARSGIGKKMDQEFIEQTIREFFISIPADRNAILHHHVPGAPKRHGNPVDGILLQHTVNHVRIVIFKLCQFTAYLPDCILLKFRQMLKADAPYPVPGQGIHMTLCFFQCFFLILFRKD